MTLGDHGQLPLAEHGYVSRREFDRIRVWILALAVVAALTITAGALTITWFHTDNQAAVRRVSCANSQALIDQFEFLKRLAETNQTGSLTQAQIRERTQFYIEAEVLARERAGNTCQSLAQMRHQAAMDIQNVIGGK